MTNPYSASIPIFKDLSKKLGFFDARFLTNWKDIVGDEIAQHCTPSKMIFDKFSNNAILFVYPINPHFKSTFTYQKEAILEKVKFYFGINFVTDVKIAKI